MMLAAVKVFVMLAPRKNEEGVASAVVVAKYAPVGVTMCRVRPPARPGNCELHELASMVVNCEVELVGEPPPPHPISARVKAEDKPAINSRRVISIGLPVVKSFTTNPISL